MLGLARQRIGEAKVGGRDLLLPFVEQRDGLLVLALAVESEDETERGARGIVAQLHRVVESRFGGGEATGVEISRAEGRPVRGIPRLGEHGGFGMVNRRLHLALGQRRFGAAGGKVGAGCGVRGATRQQARGKRGGDGQTELGAEFPVAVGDAIHGVRPPWSCQSR